MSAELTQLYEKLGVLQASVAAAHARVDEMNGSVKSDISEIKSDIKGLIAKENKRTGWVSAMVLIGSILSGLIGYFMKG